MKIKDFFYKIFYQYLIRNKNKNSSKFFKKFLFNKILLIFSYYFNKSKEEVLISDELLDNEKKRDLKVLINKVLIKNYPIEYLLKKIKFGNLELEIDENCLVPRMETEEFILYSLNYLKNKYNLNDFKFVFLELGVGSGNIILNFLDFFKYNFKNIFLGSDISFASVNLALRNFKRNFDYIDKNLFYLINSDKFSFINSNKLIKFLINNNLNLIIFSNPPYLNKKEIKKLYDPFISLYSKNKISFYLYIIDFTLKLIDSYYLYKNLVLKDKGNLGNNLFIEIFLEIDKGAFRKLFNNKRNKFLKKIEFLQKAKISKNIYYFYIKYIDYFINISFYVV